MWPFAKTNSTTMSGVITCDGKHHAWSRWEQYEEKRIAFPRVAPQGVSYVESHQRRKCEICGFTQDEKVGGINGNT